MNPAKAWAMLGPRGAGLEISSPGFNRVTQADIAGMLAHWPKGPYLMGMVRFAGDQSLMPRLAAALLVEAHRIAQEQRWPNPDRRVPGMVQLALWELLHGEACRHCGGVGYHERPGMTPKHCTVCDGHRTRRMTEEERASHAHMSERHWRRDWSKRYEVIYQIAAGWESAALSLMRAELRRNGV